jgi:hypothetical protein
MLKFRVRRGGALEVARGDSGGAFRLASLLPGVELRGPLAERGDPLEEVFHEEVRLLRFFYEPVL